MRTIARIDWLHVMTTAAAVAVMVAILFIGSHAIRGLLLAA